MEKANEEANLEFKWLKKRGVGVKNKEIKFYESFIFDGVQYKLYDCVYMYKEGLQEPYIGKLVKIWEQLNKPKRVKVHWFFRPEEISTWLRGTKTLKNEIFLGSGEGPGLANNNPLEAIAGPCNVVCVSKDSRNPQPSDEELKAADFVFSRLFDVESCTILDKMVDKVGGLEIEHIFNKKGEKVISSGTTDTKEDNANTIMPSEAQNSITNTLKEVTKGDPQENDIPNSLKRNIEEFHDRPLKKMKSNEKRVGSGYASGSDKMNDLPSSKSKVDKGEMKVSVVEKVENKERIKTPTGALELPDQSLKKSNADKKPPEHSMFDSELKKDDKLPADVDNLRTSGTPDATENQKNGKVSGKVIDDSEQKKKTRDCGVFKVPDNNKTWVNTSGKDLAANSASSKGKSGNMDSAVDMSNEEAKEELSGDNKKLSINKSFKAASVSLDKEKKNPYAKFVVTRKPNKPNAERDNWFKITWEEKLRKAYNQGKAILLHNLKPDYTSSDVESIIWSAFEEDCDAKILQRTAVSSPHSGQALILLKAKEAAQKILTKLDEECLMLSDKRPLVGTPCPPISVKKNITFFGHLAIGKTRNQNQREDEAVSTSHFSQPNTLEYDMAMEWCVLQLKSDKWWMKFYKHQGQELKKFENELKQK